MDTLCFWRGKAKPCRELFFYFYFPLGLSIAIIIFEIIRRLLIQQLIESHEKKCKRYINDKTNNPDMDYFFTVIRIMVIGQEKST